MGKMYASHDTMNHASHDTIIQVILLIYTYGENSCLSSHNYIGDMTHIYMGKKEPIIILLSSGAVQSFSGPIVLPFGVFVCAAANSGPHRTMCRWIPVFITNSKSYYSQIWFGVCVFVCASANSGPHRTTCRWIPVFITNSKSRFSQNWIGRVCVHVRCREPGAASHHVYVDSCMHHELKKWLLTNLIWRMCSCALPRIWGHSAPCVGVLYIF